MRACPRCGTQNVDGAAACPPRGALLQPLARPTGNMKQTMLGLAPNATPLQRPPPSAAPPTPAPPPPISAAPAEIPLGRAGTMIGMKTPLAEQVPTPPPAAPAPAAPGGSLKRTMLGFAAPAWPS